MTVIVVAFVEALLLQVYVLAPLVVSVRLLPVQTGFWDAVIFRGALGKIFCKISTVEV